MPEMRIPFSVFDFFVYLIPGALVLSSIFVIVWPVDNLSTLWSDLSSIGDLRFAIYGIALIISYVAGHAIAAVGSLFFEGVLIGRILGYPSPNLFKPNTSGLFRRYRQPYSAKFVSEFVSLFEQFFGKGYDAEDMFMLCHSVVKEECPASFSRLNIFIIQYDFARNLAMALLVSIPFLLWIGLLRSELVFLGLGVLSALLVVVMLLRYLKFYRRYSDEVFRSFFTYGTLRLKKGK
jgi:hypothetical protein